MVTLDNGYKMTTTFISDFKIANAFGASAVQDTFDRAYEEWKDNIVYATELAITMSIFSCYFYDHDLELSLLYSDLYHKIDNWCMSHFKDKDLQFYFKVTD